MADKKISDFTALSALTAGDLFEVETSGGNSRKVDVKLAGLGFGSSFPGSPATDDRFYRSDRRVEYFYDGAQWLSTQLFEGQFGSNHTLATITANQNPVAFWVNPWSGTYTVYIEKIRQLLYLSGTGNWTNRIRTDTPTTINDYTVSSSGSATFSYNTTFTSDRLLMQAVENSGTATAFMGASLTYRLVG